MGCRESKPASVEGAAAAPPFGPGATDDGTAPASAGSTTAADAAPPAPAAAEFPLRAASLAYLRASVCPRVQPDWAAYDVKEKFVLPVTAADKVRTCACCQN